MNNTIHFGIIMLMACFVFPFFAAPTECKAENKDIDICKEVSDEQLAKLYKKKLYPTQNNRGCFWSENPGGMAYFDIGIHKYSRNLREYWNKDLSPLVTLEKITDLGDEGLMGIGEGDLGVIIIRKDKLILKSAVTFLDIEPGSERHKVLWDIYRGILKNL